MTQTIVETFGTTKITQILEDTMIVMITTVVARGDHNHPEDMKGADIEIEIVRTTSHPTEAVLAEVRVLGAEIDHRLSVARLARK